MVGAQWKSRELNLWIKNGKYLQFEESYIIPSIPLILAKEDICVAITRIKIFVHDIFSRVLSFGVHRQWFYENCGADKWFVVLRSWSCSKHYGYYMVFSLVLFY